MPNLNLKPNHKAIRDYYASLQQYEQHDITHEGSVSNLFAFLFDTCTKQVDATLVPQYGMRAAAGNRIVLDGVILGQRTVSDKTPRVSRSTSARDEATWQKTGYIDESGFTETDFRRYAYVPKGVRVEAKVSSHRWTTTTLIAARLEGVSQHLCFLKAVAMRLFSILGFQKCYVHCLTTGTL